MVRTNPLMLVQHVVLYILLRVSCLLQRTLANASAGSGAEVDCTIDVVVVVVAIGFCALTVCEWRTTLLLQQIESARQVTRPRDRAQQQQQRRLASMLASGFEDAPW